MAGIEDFFETEEEVVEETPKTTEAVTGTEEIKQEEIPEKKVETASTEEVTPEVKEEQPVQRSQTPDTIELLQRQLQEITEELKTLRGQSTGLTKELTNAGVIDEEVVKNLEKKDAAVLISPEKLELLGTLQETMRLNPKYADIDEVCSQKNFDLLVQTLARIAVEEEGGKLTDKISDVTKQIWAMPNPYRFVYDTLKEHHPKYQSRPATATVKEKETPPTSLSKVPGGGGSHRDGWTSAKIDALEEDELHTVPKEVYELYMRNELN